MTDLIADPTPGYLVWRLSMKWRSAVDSALADAGLTHALYVVLASLFGMTRSGQAPSQREVADVTGLDAIYISRLVRRLETAGLVERAPDPDDGRALNLTITRRGEDTVESAIAVVRILQEQLTEPLGGVRGERMRRLMDDITTLIAVPATTLSLAPRRV